jgi:hypothetical protein
MPPRATSLKRIWKPLNSFPERVSVFAKGKNYYLLTNGKEYAKGWCWIFNLRKEIRS